MLNTVIPLKLMAQVFADCSHGSNVFCILCRADGGELLVRLYSMECSVCALLKQIYPVQRREQKLTFWKRTNVSFSLGSPHVLH